MSVISRPGFLLPGGNAEGARKLTFQTTLLAKKFRTFNYQTLFISFRTNFGHFTET